MVVSKINPVTTANITLEGAEIKQTANMVYLGQTVADKYNKAKEMCLFWTPDKRRQTSKASPRWEIQREKRKR